MINAEEGLLTKVCKVKELDESVVKSVEELKRLPTKRLRSEEWSKEQGLILFRGKVYVPKKHTIMTRSGQIAS